MIHRNFYAQHPFYLKLLKVSRRLQQLMQQGRQASALKISALQKRRNHYLKKLLTLDAMAAKAGGAFAFSLLLSVQVKAQQCKTFANADSANPIHRAGLPANLVQPSFVDIDGDGDLDCYESNPNSSTFNAPLKVTFLRNNGTKQTPYFVADTATGFEDLSGVTVPYNSDVQRTRFVDIDGDGDYDCFVGNYNAGRTGTVYYKNVGTATKPDFVHSPDNPVAVVHGMYWLKFNFADIDSDGDYDFVVSDLYHTVFYKNTGTKTQPHFEKKIDSYAYPASSTTVYDYNKDGLPDLSAYENFFGNAFNSYYKNVGTPQKPLFKKDNAAGPQLPDGMDVFAFTDLNNDGYEEVFSSSGRFATTAPVVTITASKVEMDSDTITKLQASPVGAGYSYKWLKNGKPIKGATGSSITVSTAGKYTAEVTASCGTGVSLPYKADAVQHNVVITTAMAEHTMQPDVSIQPVLTAYPNPFTHSFTLNLGKAYLPNTTILITDVQGIILSSIKATNMAMQLGGNLQKGVYIVRVLQNNKVVLTQKLIKQ